MFKNWKRKFSVIMAVLMLMTLIPMTNLDVQAKTVAKISKIDDINKTVKINVVFSMPTKVTATMSDKTIKAVEIKWDKKLTTVKTGIFKANGTVAGYSKKVVLTLTVIDVLPKIGSIKIPTVTDSTLKKPTDVRLGIGKASFYKGADWITVDKTLPSVIWTQNAPEADYYIIRMYDKYKQIKVDIYYGIGGNDMTKYGYYDIDLEETVNINTITITPINSVDGIAGGGDKSNDLVGETAVFECSVEITKKSGKALKVKATQLSHDPNRLSFTFPEKIASYAEYYLHSEYTITNNNRKINKSVGQGSNAEKDGSIVIYMNAAEYKEKYSNPTAKVTLSTFSNATVTNDKKASVVINVSPVTCQ